MIHVDEHPQTTNPDVYAAADMIMEATLAVNFGLTVDDIADTVHPFSTFSEAFKRAC